ncbi:MAG: putative transposase [Solirubrobacteraceae bacterium]
MASEPEGQDGGQSVLDGMPEPFELALHSDGDRVVVCYGARALAVFEAGDRAMRNMAIVSLTDAGFACNDVARVFNITPGHVSRLRRHVKDRGTAGLVAVMGRPRKLDDRARERACVLSDEGATGREIARRLGVCESAISRLLSHRPKRVETVQERLEIVAGAGEDAAAADPGRTGRPALGPDDTAAGGPAAGCVEVDGCGSLDGAGARIVAGGGCCRYAGAMLLHPFLERVGAGGVFGALSSGPAARYDTTAVAVGVVFSLALGCSSVEGSKHLDPVEVGMLVGVRRQAHLRTLRPRLSALADGCDPLAVQGALARGMLAADRQPPSVFYVDEHFVPYTGVMPVKKGWNTKRRHGEPGRHDTVIVDEDWRAVCFTTSPPQGLAGGMVAPARQLVGICGDRPIMLGFDRGGSYPKAFTALDEMNITWVTYRRAPLQAPAVKPVRRRVTINGKRRHIRVAEETVELAGYGPCRQLSIFEHGRLALQILTSDTTTAAALLAYVLRCRWRVENTFKYLEAHNGMHWLCDYRMDVKADERPARNPAREKALATVRGAESAVKDAEQRLGRHDTTSSAPDTNRAEQRCMIESDLYTARNELTHAKAALRPIPARLPANEINSDARLATPRVNRRAMQMVLRLLAYNAELDLARNLNTYLQDEDEYRTTTSHLLQQPGQINYTPQAITVTIDCPHAPRIANALRLLIDQINTTPPTLPGDPHHRPISYQIAPRT